MDGNQEIRLSFRRHWWLPRPVDDLLEGRAVKARVGRLFKDRLVDAWYRILPGDSLAGERPRTLFVTLTDGSEAVFSMTECKYEGGSELLVFTRKR